MTPIAVSTFYRFWPLSEEQVHAIKARLERIAADQGLRGLCLLGKEGINSTVSGSPESMAVFKSEVVSALSGTNVPFKDSLAQKHPFLAFKVKIKDEIVTIGRPDLVPGSAKNNHLAPAAWQRAAQEEGSVILDTRNDYEVEIGKFKNARDLGLSEFSEFPRKLEDSGLRKDQRLLMYCTGGIRCEKAILEAKKQGFDEVYQLEGGILNYLKEFPHQDFQGECFVFDYRVAVDQNLQPTQAFKLCPLCGRPACDLIHCALCGREETICKHCRDENSLACSKNCANHLALGSNSSKIHWQEVNKRRRS